MTASIDACLLSSASGPARAPRPEHRPKSHRRQAAHRRRRWRSHQTSSRRRSAAPACRRSGTHAMAAPRTRPPLRPRAPSPTSRRAMRWRAARRSASGTHGTPGDPTDRLRQQRRLIVAATEQPAAVQRHRHQQIRLAQQRRAGARHVRRQHRGKLGAVGVLERQDQPPPLRVVAQRGAGTLEHRWCAAAAGTELLGAAQRGVRERYAAAYAERLGDEAGLPKQSAHSRPGASTGASQATQCGGSSRSSSARPAPPRRDQ